VNACIRLLKQVCCDSPRTSIPHTVDIVYSGPACEGCNPGPRGTLIGNERKFDSVAWYDHSEFLAYDGLETDLPIFEEFW
jgi:hypothetical protein